MERLLTCKVGNLFLFISPDLSLISLPEISWPKVGFLLTILHLILFYRIRQINPIVRKPFVNFHHYLTTNRTRFR